MQLRDKTLVLTGASGGIGQALAIALAGEGARLVLVGRNELKLRALMQSLPGGATRHCHLVLDMQYDASIEELLQFCRELPSGVWGLINNAGISSLQMLSDMSMVDITQALDLNLRLPMVLTAGLLPLLHEQDESLIVNIGSVLGAIGHPAFSVYCASKAGLDVFSEALRRELKGSSVRVMHFNPRATDTPMNSSAVVAMNRELGVRSDAPATVATEIVRRIRRDAFAHASMGWPEKFFVKLNGLVPSLVDRSFAGNLKTILRFAASGSEPKQAPRARNYPKQEIL